MNTVNQAVHNYARMTYKYRPVAPCGQLARFICRRCYALQCENKGTCLECKTERPGFGGSIKCLATPMTEVVVGKVSPDILGLLLLTTCGG